MDEELRPEAHGVIYNGRHHQDNFFVGKQFTHPVEGHQVIAAAVFDGVSMGNGKDAARIAREVLEREFNSRRIIDKETARRALLKAHEEIKKFNEAKRKGGEYSLTTCVLSVAKGNKAWILNVGDSRAYLFRDNKATALTTPHRDERGFLTMVLGHRSDEPHPDVASVDLKKNDFLILATDGLTDVLQPGDLEKYFHENPKVFAENLKKMALERREIKNDDVTVVVKKFS